MSTTTAKASGGTTQNNSSTILYGNKASTNTSVSSTPWLDVIGSDGKAGSRISDSMDGVDKAYSSGTLAYQQAGNYVIRGVSATLSGAANTAIQSPGSDNGRRRPIHYNEVVYTTHAPSGYYYHTGLPVNGVTTESGIFANDHAARPTAAIPGELTLHQGALAAPTNFDYPARTLT